MKTIRRFVKNVDLKKKIINLSRQSKRKIFAYFPHNLSYVLFFFIIIITFVNFLISIKGWDIIYYVCYGNGMERNVVCLSVLPNIYGLIQIIAIKKANKKLDLTFQECLTKCINKNI